MAAVAGATEAVAGAMAAVAGAAEAAVGLATPVGPTTAAGRAATRAGAGREKGSQTVSWTPFGLGFFHCAAHNSVVIYSSY